ncbi:MAG: OmpH family outer membrane protein [Prevotellaceae bacterium]|jgi:outer membrane protein|nr:OmpH family outer membrane protein [Prevotellaceae bacterium]
MIMKKTVYFIANGILAAAVILLYILYFCNIKNTDCNANSETDKKDKAIVEKQNPLVPIAYINIDSLLLNYNFAKEANEKLLARSERSEAELSRKMEQWQKDATVFQQKIQSNAFLSRERAEQENAQLMKRRQDMEQLNGKLSEELLREQKKMNERLRDTINTFLKEYNKTRKYQVILSNTMNDNILYSEQGYDITEEVIRLLNERYTKK